MKLVVNLMSFSYRKGKPPEGGVGENDKWKIFNAKNKVRNPWRVEKFRKSNGLDPDVQEFLSHCGAAMVLVSNALAFVVSQRYIERPINVAIGCHGGKHRSVALVEMLKARIEKWAVARSYEAEITIVHRDLKVKDK